MNERKTHQISIFGSTDIAAIKTVLEAPPVVQLQVITEDIE